MRALNAASFSGSFSWKSMARTDSLSRRALKSFFGSFNWAPLGNVSLTALLSVSATHRIPLWDQTGTPDGLDGFFHFTSSTTAGSAFLIAARNCESLLPRQSPGSLMMASICWDADLSLGEGFALACIL